LNAGSSECWENDGSKTLLFRHFLSDTGLSEGEREEIREMIARRKRAVNREP